MEPVVPDVDWAILMARAQDGDRAAYHRLLEEVAPYLRRFVVRRLGETGDIEDGIQDALLTLHAIRHTYDPARPFKPWLVAIANRRLFDRLRRQSRLSSREIPLTSEHETFAGPEANLEERADRRSLEEAIGELTPRQREAVRLLKLREMSLQEAKIATGQSIAALKVATHRALRHLRRLLTDGSDR
jgi:RNA polymerase sigma-70 factor (ECF subfamily)